MISESAPPICDDDLQLLAQSSPAGLMLATERDWQLPRHVDLIDDLLVRVAAGELKRVIVTVPVRHGKPLYHGSVVLMGNGSRKRLEEIEVGDVVIGHSRQPRRVLAVHEQGELLAVRITTFTGREVVAALDHPFLTPDGWVNAGDLTRQHALALLPEPETESESGRPDEEFRLAGYFVGDGHTGPTACGQGFAANITCFDPIEAADLQVCADRMGFVMKHPARGRYAFSGKTYRDPDGPRPWLREHSLAFKSSWTKRVPAFVFTAGHRQVAHFVGAYFACDGTLARRGGRQNDRDDFTVEFNSVNPALLEEVRHLLLRLGVRSRLRRKNSTVNGKPYLSWRLTITTRDDVAKFVARVPMVSVKAQRLAAWATGRTSFDGPFLPDRVEQVEDAGRVPCRCLTVEGDETFTVEDLVVHNSEMCSRFFPAWLLGMRPSWRIVVAGYGSEFAQEWGEKARDLLVAHGPRFFGTGVRRDSRAKARWKVEIADGGMFALGVGSPLTGRGANVLVIDDPFKNAEEAESEVLRNKIWNWYWSTARTRLEPGGAIVLLMARWHEDDLVGRLMNHPVDIEPWTVVNLPALAEENDPLGREPGEALWPERFSREELEGTRKTMLSLWWNALYQQRPAPPEGFLFKRKDFRYWRREEVSDAFGNVQRWYVLPDGEEARRLDTSHVSTFQTVDAAISEKETADFTVVATWQATPAGDLLLIDLERRHFELQQVVEFLAAANDKHDRPPMWIERFGAGRNPLSVLAGRGYPVMEIPAEAGAQTDKITRAFGAVALCERHKLFLPFGQPEWLGVYEDELASFHHGAHDDQVDVTSYAARLLPLLNRGRPGSQVRTGSGPRPHSAGIRSQQF